MTQAWIKADANGEITAFANMPNEGMIEVDLPSDADIEEYTYTNGALIHKPQEALAKLIDRRTQEAIQLAWYNLRQKRNVCLVNCDWTQLPDVPLDTATKAAWATYRQLLRDLPTSTTDPAEPTWPTPPSESV